MPRSMTAFLASLLLLPACALFNGDTRLSTDKPAYTLTPTSSGYGGSVTLSFTNGNMSDAVGLPGCGGWSAWLERRRPSDGAWEHVAWLGSSLKCAGTQVVRAGETVSQVVSVAFPDASFAGEYRVVLDVTDLGEKQDKIPSNTFTLLPPSAP